MEKYKKYLFKFAGQTKQAEYIGKDKLNDGETVYMFKDERGYVYPIKKENICGNSKQ